MRFGESLNPTESLNPIRTRRLFQHAVALSGEVVAKAIQTLAPVFAQRCAGRLPMTHCISQPCVPAVIELFGSCEAIVIFTVLAELGFCFDSADCDLHADNRFEH